ncbi:MBL fold metallo-hydrolase [Streptomyces tricolor]|nr:MBL fold metallo-hydrolase [Streptomyces tricolor]
MVVRVVLLGTAAGAASRSGTAPARSAPPPGTASCPPGPRVRRRHRQRPRLVAAERLARPADTAHHDSAPVARARPPGHAAARSAAHDAEADHVTGLTELRGSGRSEGLRRAAGALRPRPRPRRARPLRLLGVGGQPGRRRVRAGRRARRHRPPGGGRRSQVRTGAGPRARGAVGDGVPRRGPGQRGVLVYAPCVGAWSPVLDALCADADCVLLDGTFFAADEMGTAVRSGAGQAAMGHLPVSGPDGSLAALARHPGPRRIYTHLNNTNPLLDPASPARAHVTEHGAEVLPDGSELVL